jgi:CheY-like chemotaxis protein
MIRLYGVFGFYFVKPQISSGKLLEIRVIPPRISQKHNLLFDGLRGQAIARSDWRMPLMKRRRNTVKTSRTNHAQSEFSQDNISLEGLRVLLAEDNLDQGRLYLKIVQMAGANVTLECNGQSAVDTVKNFSETYDAILMDFQMPELDGLDATRQLRAIGYRGAILAMTALGTEELRRTWLEAGCDEFLEKPIRRHQLLQAIFRSTSKPKSITI